jgi:tellurite resistance protein TerC
MDLITAFASVPWFGMPVGVWCGFLGFVLVLMLLDLGVLHGAPHEIGMRESLALSAFFLALGLGFSLVVGTMYFYQPLEQIIDPQLANGMEPLERAWHAGQLYLTGYLIEQSLSLDNIFVMSLIFSYFSIPRQYQHAVLFWGILGVILMRGAMIVAGAALITHLHWVLYVFAAFLVVTGIRMLFEQDDEPDVSGNALARMLTRTLRVSDGLHGGRFVVTAPHPRSGRPVRFFTRLFLCLATIEFADILFAIDSVPAIFSLTQEPFIVYTSNIFAILGLRSLYFALSAVVHRFHYLKYSLALVLVLIGGKILAEPVIGKLPTEFSLLGTVVLLAGGVLFSLWQTRRSGRADAATAATAEQRR